MKTPHVRMRIQRQLALGEIHDIEANNWADFREACRHLDARLAELNDRVLRFNAGLAQQPVEVQQLVANLLAGLIGQTPQQERAERQALEEAVRA